jgi:DeoR/GlpR family transcriptional regulator of sugar metabolism
MYLLLVFSTTTLQIVQLLGAFENLFIVTNGIATANEVVTNTKHRVTLFGGESQALIKRIMIANSDTSVIMVGDSKIDKKSVYRTGAIKDVSVVISSTPLPTAYRQSAKSTTFISVNH